MMKKKANKSKVNVSKSAVASKGKSSSREVPVGVKVISVLYYIFAVLIFMLGAIFILGASAADSLIEEIPELAGIGPMVFVAIGIFLIVICALMVLLGYKLWKGKNWARIVVIVLSGLGLVTEVLGMVNVETINIFSSIISILIYGAIGGYLLFSKEVKEAFE